MADQIKSLDWRPRRAEIACEVSGDLLAEVMSRLAVLLPLPE